MAADDAIRASDADREHTVGLLRDGYAVGRLSLDEFDERTTAAFASRTWGELRELTRDLPGAGQRMFRPPEPRQPQRNVEPPRAAALPRGGPGLRPVLVIALFWLTLTFTAHAAGVLIPLVFLLLMAVPSGGRGRGYSGRVSHHPPGQARPAQAPDQPGGAVEQSGSPAELGR
jgi:Domain of unknown function (DUF1707)